MCEGEKGEKTLIRERDKQEKKEKKKKAYSHAGNRTPATAVRAPDPNH